VKVTAIVNTFNPDGRATGGPVNRNTPYIVGEDGPEIFLPNSSGRILNAKDSAAKLSAVGTSSGGNVYNITVQSLVPTAATGDRILAHIEQPTRKGAATSPRAGRGGSAAR